MCAAMLGGCASPNTSLKRNQDSAHGLDGRHLRAILRQMQAWAERMQAEGKFGETEA